MCPQAAAAHCDRAPAFATQPGDPPPPPEEVPTTLAEARSSPFLAFKELWSGDKWHSFRTGLYGGAGDQGRTRQVTHVVGLNAESTGEKPERQSPRQPQGSPVTPGAACEPAWLRAQCWVVAHKRDQRPGRPHLGAFANLKGS